MFVLNVLKHCGFMFNVVVLSSRHDMTAIHDTAVPFLFVACLLCYFGDGIPFYLKSS